MATPLDMPTRRKAASVRLAYRTSTGTAALDARHRAAINEALAQAERDWPACCETGDKSLARFTGCPVCVL